MDAGREDMDWKTFIMKRFDCGFILVVGRISFERYGTTRWMNRDWRVCSMFLKPEGELTTLGEGLLGWRVDLW